ncbi:hypothetical protein KXV64_004837 [Aspergillus fumigatus]|nr:hypothetical protein KXX42_004395 [Aspergillus fumigatus]KAH2309112.1 hypothetical protein KXV47_005907 [Aspergillus fumigatus]KAH2589878.1 hypothetical protein KXV63_009613 [Aspergillus fumigatus]KAH2748377.1 hypothetical protein KXV94_004452 [Aspergillus fumigatus]KAH2869567.1 hypothetical protein KXV67_004564 [Aspergillus fumigatus]
MPPQGPYHDLWVPVENVLCALSSYALERCSSEACVRIQRAVFHAALAFSHDIRGGTIPIAQRQSVAHLLIMQRCRYV